MKDTAMKVLDEEDLEFADALRSLDVNRNVSLLITYLANVEESSSREIEMGTGLRQPEVSIAMRPLRENNWVREREVKNEGKGRPMKIYALSCQIGEIIKHFEDEKVQEAEKMMDSIRKLKELASS
jgi:predicted transcriptional regulator